MRDQMTGGGMFGVTLKAEWRKHHATVLFPLWALLLLTFAFPVFSTFRSIAVAFGILGVGVGGQLASSDAASGTEEFALSLPPTRLHRYWSGALLSLSVPLCGWVAVEFLAGNVGPKAWGLWVESGYNAPYALGESLRVRYLGVTVPAFATALAFALGKQAKSATGAIVCKGLALGICIVISVFCYQFEMRSYAYELGRSLNPDSLGWVFLTFCGAAAAPALVAGWFPYRRKEVPGSVAGGNIGVIVGALVVAVVVVLILFRGTVPR